MAYTFFPAKNHSEYKKLALEHSKTTVTVCILLVTTVHAGVFGAKKGEEKGERGC
jgi:hypothetical protein